MVRAVQAFYYDAVDRLIPPIAATLAELTPEQRSYLVQSAESYNRDFQRRYLEGERDRQLERRSRRLAKRLGFWVGKLDDSQRLALQEVLAEQPDRFADWSAYRADMQRRLIGLLEAGATAPEIDAFLRAWWIRHEGWPHTGEQRGVVVAILLTLNESLTAQQREAAVRRLGSLANDLERLVPEGTPLLATAPICALAPPTVEAGLRADPAS